MNMADAIAPGHADHDLEGNLSSVKISHNSKGTTWEIKVRNENAWRAMEVSIKIDAELRRKYGLIEGKQ